MAKGDVAIVPVRAGSKGLPGKNLRPLAGRPLYLWAVAQGLGVAPACVVTTDSQEILGTTPVERCTLYRRPDALAEDSTPMAPVLHDVITNCGLEDRRIVLLQPTTPLRSHEDIKKALRLHDTGAFDTVLSVRATDSGILKYGTMEGDVFNTVSRPEYCFYNRQDLPPVYAPNGAVYVFTAAAFLQANAIPSGRMGAVVMPEERSGDIDTEADFERVERALANART